LRTIAAALTGSCEKYVNVSATLSRELPGARFGGRRGVGGEPPGMLIGCDGPGEMSRSLLNIAKRPLPRLTLRGVGLTSKDAVS
jgi:hypothetical protein